MKYLILLSVAAVVLQGCFPGMPFHQQPRQAVPNALVPGSESDINAPARAGDLGSGWGNSGFGGGGGNQGCMRRGDGGCW